VRRIVLQESLQSIIYPHCAWRAIPLRVRGSTRVFLTEEKAKTHVDAGVKKVIFSAAAAKDDSLTVFRCHDC